MLSQNEDPCETSVLLGDSRPVEQSSRSLTAKRFRFLSETLLIPVALATRLAAGIPSTTFIELVRQTVCRLWNISHRDPATLALDGPSTPAICDAPEVAQYFATVLAILAVVRGIISIAACGVLSGVSSRYGRKPAFLFVIMAGLVEHCMIPISQYMPDWLAYWVLFMGVLVGMLSIHVGYLVSLYIVDGCAAENRTATLGRISGWAALGSCVSFALGGSITTNTGNPLIVFYVAAAIYAATFIYVALVLPESFPEEKRKALACMHSEPSIGGLPTSRSFLLVILEPLKMLVPTLKSDGTRNWRLTWCAAHAFVYLAAHAYVPTAWLVLAISKYHLTPADTGIFFTACFVSCTIVLTVLLPQLLRFLRPYYRRKVVRSAEEDTMYGEKRESETSDQLHVHLAFASCVAAATVYLVVAVSTTHRALIFSGACVGLVGIYRPTLLSLVAGSVDPLKQGEALAAIEMVFNAGDVLSPIVMGSILTATIGTTPLLMFYVHMVVVLVGSALLFLIRDADRYQRPREA